MKAYYNEKDRHAAQWLRELIKEGVITDGEVDERSIEDVLPADLAGFDRCHFFAGIGVWDYALNLAGWPDDRCVWTGSCPCQPFSAAGKGEGFVDERHLWPQWFHLVEICRPDTLFGEQVASGDGLTWFDLVSSDLEGIAYTVGAADIPVAGFGAPHRRQRLFFVADTGRYGSAERLESSQGQQLGRRDARRESDSRRASGIMAHADGGNSGTERQQRSWEQRQQPEDGGFDRLENTTSDGRREGRSESERIERRFDASERGDISGLANPETSERRRSGNETNGRGRVAEARRPSALGVVQDDAKSIGRCRSVGAAVSGSDDGRGSISIAGAGFTNGFWRDAEWIYCRDEKYRPTKPGIFPLADGAPGRVALLRGAGNAISPEPAKAFIESYLDL